MKIILGNSAGFCYGVQRAVDGAKEEVKNNDKKIYCLGEIVHNKDVVTGLEKQGIVFVDDINQSNGLTLIRAHGVPKEVYEIAKKNNIEIKDYTCPKVLKIHEIVEEYAKNGFYIFLTGSKVHPENIGTISYCGDNYSIIEGKDDLNDAIDSFKKSKITKLLLVSQTTYNLEKFKEIEEEIKKNISLSIEFITKNTICSATKLRQQEVEKIAKEVDKMIIIGGKNSSNTKKLFEIAKEHCDKTICVENEKEIDNNNYNENDTIGIMAGASTPKESIENVIKKLKDEALI